ncbi:hypothetical protein ABW19_dt0205080 [Dactylella cylindrospora]|nr:hypothetical protein ABW19_dt0205080 [Dactylella cylindrospora]
MRNYGMIVNPFNNEAKFRLRACFPPGTPIDILASGDTRHADYPVNLDMLRHANEVIMGPDWIKMTYETQSEALASLNSNGVVFDGFPIQVSVWDGADDIVSRTAAIAERPRWMVSQDSGTSLASRKPLHSGVEPTKAASPGHDRRLVVRNDETIFLKHPGLIDRVKEFIYGVLFQNTARYDEDGNYIRGSGGIFLDLWHFLMS